jgi:hypothetical protein
MQSIQQLKALSDELLRRLAVLLARSEGLLADLAPRPDVRPSIRRMPLGRLVNATSPIERIDSAVALCPEQVDSVPSGGPAVSSSGTGAIAAEPASAPGTERAAALAVGARRSQPDLFSSVPDLSLRRAASHEHWPARGEPLSPDRYRVQFTASAELRDKLERLKDLMTSSVPDGDLAAIIEAAVTEKLERLEARCFGQTKNPRKRLSDTDRAPNTRHVPAAVRRAVHERDEGRCRYVDAAGRRCTARVVQFHHAHPFGCGGDHSVANVGLIVFGPQPAPGSRRLRPADHGQAPPRERLRGRACRGSPVRVCAPYEPCACSAVITATSAKSWTEQPRETSFAGLLRPWKIGPIARAPPRRSVIL